MLAGIKSKKLFDDLIFPNMPNDIGKYVYIEPFGGSFAVYNHLPIKPKVSVYNDIKQYTQFEIKADIIHHMDFKEIFEMYNNENTFFYLDPPYYKKEYLYDLKIFEHEILRNKLLNFKGKFLLSYNNCSYIQKLYKNFTIHYYQGDNKFLHNEIVITL